MPASRKDAANLSEVIIACGACRRTDQYIQVGELLLPILIMNCSSAVLVANAIFC